MLRWVAPMSHHVLLFSLVFWCWTWPYGSRRCMNAVDDNYFFVSNAQQVVSSKLNLVDLAGSERLKKALDQARFLTPKMTTLAVAPENFSNIRNEAFLCFSSCRSQIFVSPVLTTVIQMITKSIFENYLYLACADSKICFVTIWITVVV